MPKPLSTRSLFTEGSIPKHVLKMSLTGTVGLIGIFLVDFIDMFFLSILGQSELAAAVGFAGSVTFFTTSFCIGLSIGTGIVLARLIGEKKYRKAKEEFMVASFFTLVMTVIITSLIYPFTDEILMLLDAKGLTAIYAEQYLQIVVPVIPFLGLALCFSAALRGLGAAHSSMYVTLGGSLINGLLDPLFIFYFELGVKGAAIASAISIVCMFLIALSLLLFKYHFIVKIPLSYIPSGIKKLLPLVVPAVLTNFATPAGNAYIVYKMANYGDEAVSGFSIIGRIIPVAFAVVFALSGAIGPIIGQNLGAANYERIKQTIRFSYLFIVSYVIIMWLILNAGANFIIDIFRATGDSKGLILLFCDYLCLAFMFVGITFVSNAFFNNMGKPHYSTVINWAKATIGTIPFVYIGSHYYGDDGLLLGQSLGHIVFGVLSYWLVSSFISHCERKNAQLAH